MADDWHTAESWIGARLNAHSPNLILLGAMTVSAHGAKVTADFIRASVCSEALIVLGGKHVTETMWIDQAGVHIHPGAPIREPIGSQFDLFVSGDSEEVIAEIGEVVTQTAGFNGTRANRTTLIMNLLGPRLTTAPGDWAVFWLQDGSLRYLPGPGLPARPDDYPLVYEMYPINAYFPVLPGEQTAHGYSYTSKGCIHRCHFCSESAEINGSVHGIGVAGKRLARQMERLASIAGGAGRDSLSVFVEDSIFLQGAPAALQEFCREIDRLNTKVRFGGQFTIDMILEPRRQQAILELAKRGLSYIFLGLETNDESIAENMAKYSASVKRRSGHPWITRVELALQFLQANHIDAGVSILFGLGEDQGSRLALMRQLNTWQKNLGQPRVVSLNWAVKHPMRARSDSQAYTYTCWSVDPDDPRLQIIQRLFGEASTNFCFPGSEMASRDDLQEIELLYLQLQNKI